ncbi:MAG: hypothetical protein AAB890_02805 [Patescibacteria group bacterium]
MNYELLLINLEWLPEIFFWAIFLASAYLYFYKFRQGTINYALYYRRLIVGLISFRVFYAALLTISQYYIWSQNKFTQLLLNSPLDLSMPASGIFTKICQLSIVNCQKSGYFLFYSYGRFWLNALISIAAAFVFYLFLRALQKHQARFFEEGETELGLLSALIVGWPNFIVFLLLVFITVILVSVSRRLFFSEIYTTFGVPFLLSVLLLLLFGNKLTTLLNLNVLYI